MKKAFIIAVLAFLLAAPRVLAHDRNLGLQVSSHVEDDHDCSDASFHAGNNVEEEHESDQAKLHEHEDENDGEDCSTASPTASPTGTAIATATPTPTGTPVATATPTETPTPTGEGSLSLQALIHELIDLLNKLLKGE